MKSIFSIVLTAVMLLSVLTGCGRRNRNDDNAIVNNTPAATTMPARNTPSTAVNGAGAGDAANRVENDVNDTVNGVENGVNNAVNGVENGANDVITGMENGADDLLGNDGVVNGETDDGRVEDDSARTDATPKAQ